MNLTLHPDWKKGPLGYGVTINGHRATVRAVQVATRSGFVRRWQAIVDGVFIKAVYPTALDARIAAEERIDARSPR